MKQTESARLRYRYVRLAGAMFSMSLALLAMRFSTRSPIGHALLLASLTLTSVGVLVLARRPGHRPSVVEIALPLATLAILALGALHYWR